jgi:hypothetical protein
MKYVLPIVPFALTAPTSHMPFDVDLSTHHLRSSVTRKGRWNDQKGETGRGTGGTSGVWQRYSRNVYSITPKDFRKRGVRLVEYSMALRLSGFGYLVRDGP